MNNNATFKVLPLHSKWIRVDQIVGDFYYRMLIRMSLQLTVDMRQV